MEKHQAVNLAYLAWHMGTIKRALHMNYFTHLDGSPSCALGECAEIPRFQKLGFSLKHGTLQHNERLYPMDAAKLVFGLTTDEIAELFGAEEQNIWRREVIFPNEWATEACNTLRAHGFDCVELLNSEEA